jgi:hypothetical protein
MIEMQSEKAGVAVLIVPKITYVLSLTFLPVCQ